MRDDLELWGYWTDPSRYQRIEFMLMPCNYVHVMNGGTWDSIHPECVEDLEKQQEYLGNMQLVIYASDSFFN